MFIDASALTAILVREADADKFVSRIEQTANRTTSPVAVWETAVAISRILDMPPSAACRGVLDYLTIAKIELSAISAETASTAVEAFERFGKGRHKAGLNFGDCFAYACAKHQDAPLLFKGNDFSLTDIDVA